MRKRPWLSHHGGQAIVDLSGTGGLPYILGIIVLIVLLEMADRTDEKDLVRW